eukprot:gene34292-41504_t
MGNGALFGRKPPPERRPPLTTASQVVNNLEAKERIAAVMKLSKPGVPFRWEKILNAINREKEPTKEEPDPLRIKLEVTELKELMRLLFHEIKFISSDGLGLARTFMPYLYEKHTVERAKQVSVKEREAKKLDDTGFAYGEIDWEIFATMFIKITSVYGQMEGGNFYDLGCGAGLLMYAAAFIGQFNKITGIELIGSLLERGEKRKLRFDLIKSQLPPKVQNMQFEFIEDDFVENDYWTDATFIFLHWTALSPSQCREISTAMCKCVEGTHVITFTRPLLDEHKDFDMLLSDTCDTSWGKTEFFLHEKVTPARLRNAPVPVPVPVTTMRSGSQDESKSSAPA